MKLGRGVVAVGGILTALSAGCGSSGGSSGPSVARACADVAGARCSEGSVCSLPEGTTGTGFNILENYGDKQTCLTRQTLACMDGLMAPGTGNSPTKVESCSAELLSSSCQDFFDNQPPTDCAVTGSRANGAGCTFNGQCTSGYCQGTKTSVCGTCADVPAVGSDCSASACAPGQRCIASTLQCQTLLQMNAMTCDTGHPCDRGLVCVGNDTATNTLGTCETAGTRIGQACGGTMPACDGTLGLYCGGPSGAKTCMLVIYPGATYSADGGIDAGGGAGADAGSGAGLPCGVLADGTHHGCVAGGCYTATGPATGTDLGTCVPFAPDNMPCNSTVGPDCMPPARCVATGDAGTAGTCQVPTATMCPGS